MSIVIVATAKPLPDQREAVISLIEEVIATVHAEDAGCELYALHEGKDRLVFIEKWSDKTAMAAHSRGDGLKTLLAGLDGKLTEDLDVQVLTPHPAGEPLLGAI